MKKLSYLFTLCLMVVFGFTEAQNCTADFGYTTNGLTVNFQDSSTSNSGALSYSWDINGNIYTSMNPSHTFTTAGTYFVCLTVSTRTCSDSTCTNIVVTTQSAACNADFSYWVDSTNSVDFTSHATATGTTYSWDFGDGNSDSAANPTHNYGSSGAYGVTLTVVDTIGDTCSFYDTVYVNECFLSVTLDTILAGSLGSRNYTSYKYNVESHYTRLWSAGGLANGNVIFSWDYGNGTGGTSNTGPFNGNAFYYNAGTYAIMHKQHDTITNNMCSFVDTITVSVDTPACQANFTIAKDSSGAFNVILWNNSTNASSHVYSWDFGDGTTGSGRTPIHTYQSFGSYQVCLTITDSILGCDTTIFCDSVGMDSLGNLKAGFGIEVRDPLLVSIEEQKDDFASLSLFPNPANDKINLDLRGIDQSLNIRIMDLSGRVILEQNNTPGGNLESFDISQFNRGIYFMLLDNGYNQKVEKFIVAN